MNHSVTYPIMYYNNNINVYLVILQFQLWKCHYCELIISSDAFTSVHILQVYIGVARISHITRNMQVECLM